MSQGSLDFMDGSTKEKATDIHQVTPDGIITNTVGKTSSNFNIGVDAMRIWEGSKAPIR